MPKSNDIRQARTLQRAPPVDALRLLGRSPVFSSAPERVLQSLAAAGHPLKFPKGARLWDAGTHPTHVFVIGSGLVKIVQPSEHANVLCGLVGAPSCLGELAVAEGTPYRVTAVSATNVSAYAIPSSALEAALKEYPELAMAWLHSVAAKLELLHKKIEILSAGAVCQRMASVFVWLYELLGDDLEDGSAIVPVHLTRMELADLVGTTYESAVRQMTDWESRRLVMTTSGGFTLPELDKLRHIAANGERSARTSSERRSDRSAA